MMIVPSADNVLTGTLREYFSLLRKNIPLARLSIGGSYLVTTIESIRDQ